MRNDCRVGGVTPSWGTVLPHGRKSHVTHSTSTHSVLPSLPWHQWLGALDFEGLSSHQSLLCPVTEQLEELMEASESSPEAISNGGVGLTVQLLHASDAGSGLTLRGVW